MAVRVKLLQNNVKSSPNYGKYYAKAIPQGEVTLEQLMKEAQEHSSATEAQVKKVVLELKNLMKSQAVQHPPSYTSRSLQIPPFQPSQA